MRVTTKLAVPIVFLLSAGCSNAVDEIQTGASIKVSYVRDCPCWDGDLKNTGTVTELPALTSADIALSAGSTTGSTTARAVGEEVVSSTNSLKSLAYRHHGCAVVRIGLHWLAMVLHRGLGLHCFFCRFSLPLHRLPELH